MTVFCYIIFLCWIVVQTASRTSSHLVGKTNRIRVLNTESRKGSDQNLFTEGSEFEFGCVFVLINYLRTDVSSLSLITCESFIFQMLFVVVNLISLQYLI